MQGLKAETHYRYNQQSNTISFPNGSQILLKDLFLYPSDPNFDELGSLEITDAFIDECNQTVEKAFNVVKSRIRYKLDENNLYLKC
jgi:phage terminase large subunit